MDGQKEEEFHDSCDCPHRPKGNFSYSKNMVDSPYYIYQSVWSLSTHTKFNIAKMKILR